MLTLGVAGLVVAGPLQVLVLSVVAVAALAAAGRLHAAVPYLKVALYVGLFLALLNPLFSRGGLDVLWQASLGPVELVVTVQGIAFGVTSALRLAAVTSAFALFTLAIDADDQLVLMSRVSFRSGLVLSLASRLFPVISRDAARIADAQRARGVELDRGSRRRRIMARLPLLSALINQSLERAVDVAASMEARGYGAGPRTRWVRGRRWTTIDTLTAAAVGVAVTAMIAGIASGAARYTFFPLMDDPWPGLVDPWWLALLAALSLPLLAVRPWRR